MMYSNALNGLKKIYIAQFLSITSAVCSGLATLIANIVSDEYKDILEYLFSPVGVLSVSLAILSTIAMLLMAVLGFIGYIQASRDEPEFRKSMICVIIVAVFYTISMFFKVPNGMLYTIFFMTGTIVEMFVMAFSVSGIINIAANCEDEEVQKRGDRVMTFILVSYLASSINAIVYRIFELSPQVQTVAVIIGALDLLLSISQFIVYMSYLRRAIVMLKPEKKDE